MQLRIQSHDQHHISIILDLIDSSWAEKKSDQEENKEKMKISYRNEAIRNLLIFALQNIGFLCGFSLILILAFFEHVVDQILERAS